MSKHGTPNLNIHHVMKDNKYKINRVVIQNEILPRNRLDQLTKLVEGPAIRAIQKVQQIALENHITDFINLESTTSRLSQPGYGV